MSALRKGTDQMGIDNLEKAVVKLSKLTKENENPLSEFLEFVKNYHASTQSNFPKFGSCYESVGGAKAKTYAIRENLEFSKEQLKAIDEIPENIDEFEDDLSDFATYDSKSGLWSPSPNVFNLSDPQIANVIKAHINGLAGGLSCHRGLLGLLENATK